VDQDTTAGEALHPPNVPRRNQAAPSPARVAAFGVGVVVVALLIASVPLQSAAHLWAKANTPTFPIAVACVFVGVLLAARRPDNVMGWFLLAGALFLALNLAASAYSVLDYRLRAGTLPLGGVAVLLQPSWAPGIVCLGIGLLVFPDGHIPSRLVRWATWIVVAAGTVWMGGAFGMVTQALLAHAVRVTSAGTLVAFDHPSGPWAWWGPVQEVFFVTLGASWIVWGVQQVLRYKRLGTEERHQMKWLMSGAIVTIVGASLAASGLSGDGWALWVGVVCMTALPVSIAVGVTKFHLYDIDRFISRTLSYALLTGLVVGVYVGVVTLATKGVGFSSPVAVGASTLAAVALFNPLRKRLQRGVDRRFNRARYDLEQTVSAFAGRLRESVDPGSVTGDLMDVVHAAFEPAASGLWIRREEPV
jgi:hypothetical protein